VPVYVRVRRYQDWLDDALMQLGFDLCARQAVMVKHIAAGVRAAAFTPLSQRLEAVPSPAKPPTNGIDMAASDELAVWASGTPAETVRALPD
jgi:hypothetical protein